MSYLLILLFSRGRSWPSLSAAVFEGSMGGPSWVSARCGFCPSSQDAALTKRYNAPPLRPSPWHILAGVRCCGFPSLVSSAIFMEAHAGWTHDISAHAAHFRVERTDFCAAISALRNGAVRTRISDSIFDVSGFNHFAGHRQSLTPRTNVRYLRLS